MDSDRLDQEMFKFQHDVKDMGVSLAPFQLAMFKRYRELLLNWNRKINLISRRDTEHILDKHVCESISLLDVSDIAAHCAMIDVGTGAGFPGIPLKIVRPDLRLTLLDSKRMKTLFLRRVVLDLGLDDTEVIEGRMEELSHDEGYRGRYDVIVSRAVTDLAQLFTWSHRFLTNGGVFLAIKGGDLEDEVDEFNKNFPGYTVEDIPVISRLVPRERNLSIIKIYHK
ncbi:16S rRNA (guanine(527)-N(7))-methyltransferase RsmG [candidate division KSB1 bacterium]|nr:16S rRNA (guanine(527)-N(7))-methyltransferase RsmG [candidate division KSB1 bacterium]